MAEEKVWLITGTSTGFGKNLVEELQKLPVDCHTLYFLNGTAFSLVILVIPWK
jgi:hypothetical protein